MKKFVTAMAVVMTCASLSACGGSTTPSTTAAAASTTAAVAETTAAAAGTTAAAAGTTAAASNSGEDIKTIGTIDKSQFAQPVLVTSFGQSTDAAMLDTVMKKLGVDYKYNSLATADDVAGCKTVIITVGASTKGMGAAGISADQETARATALMEAVKNEGASVICVHIGGSARRGSLSDVYADMVLDQAKYIIVKEDGNQDGKFTDFAASKNIPVTVINNTKNTVNVLTDLFAK